MRKYLDRIIDWVRGKKKPVSIQMTLSVSFTVVAMACMCFLGILLYEQFVRRSEQMTEESSEQLLNQTAINLEEYLRNMRRVSDAMFYAVIKDKDMQVDRLDAEMDLLYEVNRDKLVSIACYYTENGELVDAAPIATIKTDVDIREQEWFKNAVQEVENFHFSTPHVQNLFDDPSYRYYWVISLSRIVELTRNGVSLQGVLLVDMNYSSIVQLLNKANTSSEGGGYVYLMDQNGEVIYHPKQELIRMGLVNENNLTALSYDDASHRERFEGSRRMVTVKTVSYTGWKLVRVVPQEAFAGGILGTRYLAILMVALSVLFVIVVNQFVSARISKPLRRLNESVRDWEAGNLEPDIYVGGSLEVEHLGKTLRSSMEQSRQLMEEMVIEQEEKRKSELDALQSQINPHFLYNTLDSILWMIQGGRTQDAVFMIKQLASLFRISLSRGNTIISIRDEIHHAQNYMNIQQIRYKNGFSVTFDVAEDILDCCTVKLIIQPILENAIYYGMEYMEDEGEIHVIGRREGDDIYLDVCDNGPGLPEEEAAHLLTDTNRERSRGSGVGLINVHNRIRLRFGQEYGLEVEAHPDEGMRVRIHIPWIPFTKEAQQRLENGKERSL